MHKTHRIISALLLALLCSLPIAALTGCNEKQNATAPTEATPTAEATPTVC